MRLIENQECQDITKYLQRARVLSVGCASTRAWATGEEVEGSGGQVSAYSAVQSHWGSSSSPHPPLSLLLSRMEL